MKTGCYHQQQVDYVSEKTLQDPFRFFLHAMLQLRISEKIAVKKLLAHFTLLSLLIPSENIRKPEVFWCFQGVSKEISGMKYFNLVIFQGRLFRTFFRIDSDNHWKMLVRKVVFLKKSSWRYLHQREGNMIKRNFKLALDIKS